MGKIRRTRQKLHIQAVKPANEEKREDVLKPNESSLAAIFPTAGLFDAAAGSKDGKQGRLENVKSKKARRKERHDNFLKKLHASKLVEEKNKKAEKRAKTVVVGDMEPLLLALPTINVPELVGSLNSADERSGKAKIPNKNVRRHKVRQALQASEITHFKQVLNHPAFKANPIAAISEHIKNVVQRENENT